MTRPVLASRLFMPVVTFLVVVVTLYPVYSMVIGSLQPITQIVRSDFILIPETITLQNYEAIFTRDITVPTYFLNSVTVASLSTFLSVVISTLGGYSLARLPCPGKGIIDKCILFVYIVPAIALVIPIYVIFVKIGLVDTFLSVALTHTLFAIPLGVWMLRAFFHTIPLDLEDAARVDGCDRLGVLYRVVLPLATPGVAAVAIFAFVVSWDEFLFASLLINSEGLKTLPVGIYSLVGTYGDVRWGQILASSTIAALPMFFLFFGFERWLVQGLSAGAVKG